MSNPYNTKVPADRLIEKNTGLVKKYAYFYAGRVQKAAEVEDLLQVGMMGLIEAAHNYENREGVAFESYARMRIKGSIVDYLRKISNLCRTTVKQKQNTDKGKFKTIALYYGLGLLFVLSRIPWSQWLSF